MCVFRNKSRNNEGKKTVVVVALPKSRGEINVSKIKMFLRTIFQPKQQYEGNILLILNSVNEK